MEGISNYVRPLKLASCCYIAAEAHVVCSCMLLLDPFPYHFIQISSILYVNHFLSLF